MQENVYFVFSLPPAGVSAAEYGRWYEDHVRDILAVDGFAAARRFDVVPTNGTASPTMYPHLAIYGLEGDRHEAMRRLSDAVADGRVPLPEWFDGIRFASFHAHPLEGPVDLTKLDQIYLVFSRPPERIPLPDYLDWYATHARENLTADGFEATWRYRVEPDTIDPQAPCECVHAALYEVHGELPDLRAALKAAAAAGRVGFPDWFGDILFASVYGNAASPALVGAAA